MSILHKLNVQHAIRHIFSVICKGFLKYFFLNAFIYYHSSFTLTVICENSFVIFPLYGKASAAEP